MEKESSAEDLEHRSAAFRNNESEQLPAPDLPEGFCCLGEAQPLLGTFDSLWGVLAVQCSVDQTGDMGYLVFDITGEVVFLVVEECTALFDQIAEVLPCLLPFCEQRWRPELFARIASTLPASHPKPFPQGKRDNEQRPCDPGEATYMLLLCEDGQSRQIADRIENAAREQGTPVSVLLCGRSNKVGSGFVLMRLQQNQEPFLTWLRDASEIQDVVSFVLTH
jgi:hypothetical protein